jgi:hypothetical protein
VDERGRVEGARRWGCTPAVRLRLSFEQKGRREEESRESVREEGAMRTRGMRACEG